MVSTELLNTLRGLTRADKLYIMQVLITELAEQETEAYPNLTETQQQELDRRIADHEENPNNVLTWEEIKTSIKRQ